MTNNDLTISLLHLFDGCNYKQDERLKTLKNRYEKMCFKDKQMPLLRRKIRNKGICYF